MKQFLLTFALFILVSLQIDVTVSAQNVSMSNADVITLTKAGIDKSVIIAKIRNSSTSFDLSTESILELKREGVDDEIVAIMIASKSKATEAPDRPRRLKDELGSMFRTLKDSVVTVWSEFGHGSGFIVDSRGLVVTNFHVIGPSRFISVQFDENRKVEARILATDPEKDVAVLWINIGAFPDAKVAIVADTSGPFGVEEGERVMSIGSPMNQRKIMTTGVVSKVEERAIISDVNINKGNSGGPLFNSVGEVIGITTFADRSGGPGISGIVRIEQALQSIEEARKRLSESDPPSPRLLPVEPKGEYPIAAIREVATEKKFDANPYVLDVGKFKVWLITPRYKYRLATEMEREALKGRKGREQKSEIKGTFNPFQDLYGWAEYVGEYKPVLHIRIQPELAETGGSIFGRILVEGMTGVQLPAKMRFRADFYKMRLYCGDSEVEPIQRIKVAHMINESNRFFNLKDATYSGFYTYPADAINAGCPSVRIEVMSEEKPDKPEVGRLKEKHIQRLALDFKPYFDSASKTP